MGGASRGGKCGAAAVGREDGVALSVRLSLIGQSQFMLRGRVPSFAAVSVNSDEVQTPPPGVVILARNSHSKVQAMVCGQDDICFWGSGDHPEQAATMALTPDLFLAELGHDMRTRELPNWLAIVVGSTAA